MGRGPFPAAPPSASVSPEGPDRGQSLEGPLTGQGDSLSSSLWLGPRPRGQKLTHCPSLSEPRLHDTASGQPGTGCPGRLAQHPCGPQLAEPQAGHEQLLQPPQNRQYIRSLWEVLCVPGGPVSAASLAYMWFLLSIHHMGDPWSGRLALTSQVGTLGQGGVEGSALPPPRPAPTCSFTVHSHSSSPTPHPGLLWVERQPPPAVTQSPPTLTWSPQQHHQGANRGHPAGHGQPQRQRSGHRVGGL